MGINWWAERPLVRQDWEKESPPGKFKKTPAVEHPTEAFRVAFMAMLEDYKKDPWAFPPWSNERITLWEYLKWELMKGNTLITSQEAVIAVELDPTNKDLAKSSIINSIVHWPTWSLEIKFLDLKKIVSDTEIMDVLQKKLSSISLAVPHSKSESDFVRLTKLAERMWDRTFMQSIRTVVEGRTKDTRLTPSDKAEWDKVLRGINSIINNPITR